MALSRLDQLYRQVILDHSSNPRHFGTLDSATNQIELNNPTCGDVVEVQLVVEDDKVKDLKFTGQGCSISTASTSMMTEVVIGKSIEEVQAMSDDFSLLVQGEEVKDIDALGDASLLSGVAKFPARIRCATLGWKALEKALEEGSGVEGHLHS